MKKGAIIVSVIDSRRYGRRSTTSFTREEFMQIKNTPPADDTELNAECERVMANILAERAQNNACVSR